MKNGTRRLIAATCGWAGLLAAQPGLASDHADTPELLGAGRHDARITDLYAFARADRLVLVVCLDPTVAAGIETYSFAPDLRVRIHIDNDSPVTFDDPYDLDRFGGTIAHPHQIQADITFRVEFTEAGQPLLTASGIPPRSLADLELFAGPRDDPFIRGPRIGRNVAAIVLELPLEVMLDRQSTLLLWATTAVDDLPGSFQDMAGRALRSQFPENMTMNALAPKLHARFLETVPDVMIYDVALPATYPNGRSLSDDVVDLVGDQRLLMDDFPFPDENDVPLPDYFPYLAPPH